MTNLTKRRRNGNTNGGCFPLRNDLLTSNFLTPRMFDLDTDMFTEGLNTPLANIEESNKDFKLELSAPGMKRDDFKVDVEDGILTISSEKEEEKKDSDKNFRRREFSYTSFSRSFTLPDNVDESNINAKYDNGMLQVTIPKKEVSTSKPKKQIQVA